MGGSMARRAALGTVLAMGGATLAAAAEACV